MIDSFGYQVLSLDEVIDQLIAYRQANPKIGAMPVWVDRITLIHPVKGAKIGKNGLELILELGA